MAARRQSRAAKKPAKSPKAGGASKSPEARSGTARPAELVKMSELARLSEVPAATIKHYLREGLLPPPARRTSRNMAFYDPTLVDRIQTIKRLQREHFLPLRVIKELLDVGGSPDDARSATAIARVLQRSTPQGGRTRADLLDSGVKAAELDLLKSLGLTSPDGSGDDELYTGDDLALLKILGASRKAGLNASMLPATILQDYLQALRTLVRTELELFRRGVLTQATGDSVDELTEVATTLSEQLVVLMRRKLLLPTLKELAESQKAPSPRKRSKKTK